MLEDELNKTKATCNVLVAENAALKSLEPLLSDQAMQLLLEAEEQMELVDETIKEIEANDQPNLGIEDKALLDCFYADSDAFTDTQVLLTDVQPVESVNGNSANGKVTNGQSSNGQSSNGQSSNGQSSNGRSFNKPLTNKSMNGRSVNGNSVNGNSVNGSLV